MKTLAIILAIFFTLNTIAQTPPPVSLRGRGSSTKLLPKWNIQVPSNQATNLGGIDALIETGNSNLLINPSFEHVTVGTGWTATTTGPAAQILAEPSSNSGGAPEFGLQHARFRCDGTAGGAGTCTFVQDVLTKSTAQALAYIRISAEQDSVVKVYSRVNGVTDTTRVLTVDSSRSVPKWDQLYKIPVISGSTSTGIEIRVTVTSIESPFILGDDAFVGAVDLKTDSVQIQTQTTKFAAGSTGAGVTLTGTPTTVGGGNFTISSGVSTALRDINVTITCTTTNSAAAHTGPTIYVNGASTGQNSNPPQISGFSAIATWSGIVPAGQNFYCVNAFNTASGGNVNILATNTVNTQIYSASCGAECEDTFSAHVSSSGVVSGENIEWITGNAAITSVSIYTSQFKPGLFTVAPNCWVQMVGGVTISTSLSANTTQVQYQIYNSSTTAATTAAHQLFCTKTGADFVASRTIVGSFSEVMTTPNVSKPKTCYYAFGGASATLSSPTLCTTGTCTEMYDSCGTVTPPAFASTGQYTNLTFANGTFSNSTPVHCSCNSYQITNATSACYTIFDTGDQTFTSNSSGGYVANFIASTVTGVAINSAINIKCEGQAP